MLAGVLLASASTVCAQSTRRSKTRPARAQVQSPARPDSAFDQVVKLGDEARLAGRLDEAFGLYTKALAIQPKWTEGWWNVGAILYEKDRYPEARDAFRNVVA